MDGKLTPWLPAVTAITGIAVFAATTCVYFAAHTRGVPGGYVPFFAGALFFSAVVGVATYVSAPGRVRVWSSVAAILVSAAVFGISLLFILLNVLGS
jgi:hypothetical protein